MTDFPKSHAFDVTEHIMLSIADHIKRDPAPQQNHHYNRAFEKILSILTAEFSHQRKL